MSARPMTGLTGRALLGSAENGPATFDYLSEHGVMDQQARRILADERRSLSWLGAFYSCGGRRATFTPFTKRDRTRLKIAIRWIRGDCICPVHDHTG
jgi:hypothetical protein